MQGNYGVPLKGPPFVQLRRSCKFYCHIFDTVSQDKFKFRMYDLVLVDMIIGYDTGKAEAGLKPVGIKQREEINFDQLQCKDTMNLFCSNMQLRLHASK